MTISLTRTRTYGRVERKGRSMINSKSETVHSRRLGTIGGGVKADTKAWFVCLYSEALEIHSMSFDLQSYSQYENKLTSSVLQICDSLAGCSALPSVPSPPSTSLLKCTVTEGLLRSTSVPCVPGGLAVRGLSIVEDV